MHISQLGQQPFRGSVAVRDGQVTRAVLRSPRFVRVFPDVYVLAEVERTHAVLAAAATVLLPGAVITGVSALEVAGVPCALPGDRVEVTLPPGSRGVAVPGLRVRRRRVPESMVFADPFPRLHPTVAAVDLAAERRPHVEAVVVLDQVVALRVAGPAGLEMVAETHRGRGRRQLLAALADADFLAESPQETRLRLPPHRCSFGPGAGSRGARSVARGAAGSFCSPGPTSGSPSSTTASTTSADSPRTGPASTSCRSWGGGSTTSRRTTCGTWTR